ncbi:MAG: hypothetical protein ACK4Y5_06605 [Acetobacteraceae bacterium]|jgi:hypothetical protein
MPDIIKSREQVNRTFVDLQDGTFAEQQAMVLSDRLRDAVGRLKVSLHQNIYEADFEYGSQPLRWESLTANGGTVTHLPGLGGVRMRVPTTSGAVAIRQSRPYHRYQPGKTMFMATAIQLGPAITGNLQRVGFFDDSNGVFFEDAGASASNPTGLGVVVRSDINGLPVDTRVPLNEWNGNRAAISQIDWGRIQMLWIEYAWYGAGAVRFGCFIEGQPIVLHQIGFGNRVGQVVPWSRTGNLPVRYEQRNTATISQQNDMFHYGVSVLVEGRVDDQRGFTYAYGPSSAAPRRSVASGANRFPVLSYRGRPMGTVEFTEASGAITGTPTTTTMTVAGTPFTANALIGRMVYWPTLNQVARITANTNNTITYADNVLGGAVAVAPTAGIAYQIGLINRGQMLPRRLQLTSDQPVLVEIFMSAPPGAGGGPVALTGASFVALSTLGSAFSFAERDISATAFTGGENVYSLFVPANNPVDNAIDNLLALVNTIRGDRPDIMTIAVTNPGATAANVSAQIIGQEAMS